MAADPVTPVAGLVSMVTTGGVAVTVVPGGPNGGFITNPYTAADQGIVTAENLYVDAVNPATTTGNGTTFTIFPGGSWPIIPGQTTVTTVNSVTDGHRFSVTWY